MFALTLLMHAALIPTEASRRAYSLASVRSSHFLVVEEDRASAVPALDRSIEVVPLVDPAQRRRRPLHPVREWCVRRNRQMAKQRKYAVECTAVATAENRDDLRFGRDRALQSEPFGVSDRGVAGHVMQIRCGGLFRAHDKGAPRAHGPRDRNLSSEQSPQTSGELVTRVRDEGRRLAENDDRGGKAVVKRLRRGRLFWLVAEPCVVPRFGASGRNGYQHQERGDEVSSSAHASGYARR